MLFFFIFISVFINCIHLFIHLFNFILLKVQKLSEELVHSSAASGLLFFGVFFGTLSYIFTL